VIQIQDANGNVVISGPDSTAMVSLALSSGAGVLSGTISQVAVAGVADFSSDALKINLVGTNKGLTATKAGVVGGAVRLTANSQAFTMRAGPASQLQVATQPNGGPAGAPWSTQPIIQITDAQGNLITTGSDATQVVSVALTTGSGVLSGTLS